ncbi:uncharacterized protein LOC6577314 [Drosophila mojavensis]|uniref:Uncharacterized protein, isoform A n=1 Tax=Drosophila mojavensis TaxID=7230 RepID=B4KKQ9_DROMO|nr:uncharacterized protein LOC6577314 [Drosophila mojavensis]EDW12723.1 uncharacterized protein Dmoj_GI23392, isoform A [Drosophila mojavensis]KRG03394.1 uncharacterized protein Dmoj_GI23392, isoform B [Drosophila mojavensis]
MLARKSQLTPRTPPVHERIALLCARNICKLAAALPKPRTRSGYLPVLVELRRADEDVVYRYQVNLPPNCLEGDGQQMNMAQAKAITQQLKLPCLVHGALEPSAQPQAVLPMVAEDGEAPQLILMQDAVHVVHEREDFGNMGPTPSTDGITTFQNAAYASGASKITRDHFMAVLHNQRRSPLQFETLWADQHLEGLETIEQVINACQSRPIELPGLHEPFTARHNKTESQLQLKPYTGRGQASPPKAQTGNFQGNGHQYNPAPREPANVREERLPKRALNGYKQQRKPSRSQSFANSTERVRCQPKRLGNGNREAPSQPALGSSGYRPQPYEPAFYCSIKDYIANQQQSRQRIYLPSGDPLEYRMEGSSPLYAHLPRVDSNGHPMNGQRQLLRRQKLEQDLDYQRHEQQKYKRSFTEPSTTSQVPQELQSLFHWDCCHLCHTAMRTMRNALDHYLSRTHLRRVDSWLIRYSFIKGNLSEDMLRHLRSSGPAVLHCDLCDLKLTSVIHARQHFYGRRHRLVERHISKPNGEGYYDKSGRWVRTNDKWLMCKLCDVIVTSESQLSIHMAGLRHRKRERSSGPGSMSEPFDGSHVYRINANGSLVPLNPLGCYMYSGYNKPDFSKINDLNAAYYCEVCNITLNHLKSVKQHEEGRVHRKRLERIIQ